MRRLVVNVKLMTPQCELIYLPTLYAAYDRSCRRRDYHNTNDLASLRLKIFRSLGIDIEPDEAGNFNRAVIRNSRKGDVHVVNIDPKFSKFFYANYFWSTMQG